MQNILIAGAGKIGTLIACLLSSTPDYKVHLVDLQFNQTDIQRFKKHRPDIHTETLNVQDPKQLEQFIKTHSIKTVISSLPYFVNNDVAAAAAQFKLNYFDLTEDV